MGSTAGESASAGVSGAEGTGETAASTGGRTGACLSHHVPFIRDCWSLEDHFRRGSSWAGAVRTAMRNRAAGRSFFMPHRLLSFPAEVAA